MAFQREQIDDGQAEGSAHAPVDGDASVGQQEAQGQLHEAAWSVPAIPRQRLGWLPALPPALYALLLLSFVLPFMTVSCNAGGFPSRRTYTGVDLLRDKPVHDLQRMLHSSNPGGGDAAGTGNQGTFTLKYQLLFAIAMAALGLIASFWRGRAGRAISMAGGVLAIGGLLWFKALWDSTIAQWEGASTRYREGFLAALACAALASLTSALIFWRERPSNE